jgi:hypothetical protein
VLIGGGTVEKGREVDDLGSTQFPFVPTTTNSRKEDELTGMTRPSFETVSVTGLQAWEGIFPSMADAVAIITKPLTEIGR